MAYKKIEKATLDSTLASYKTFFEDHKKAAADKKMKAQAKDLEKQLKVKSANFGAYLMKLANEAKGLYNEHNLKVEKWLNDGVLMHKDLKNGVATLNKNKSLDTFNDLVKLGPALEKLAKTAKEDSGELAEAWMEVREGNYGGKGFEAKDLKPFSDTRAAIISGLKATGAKLNKLFQLADEGKVYINDLRIEIAKGAGKPESTDLMEGADELAKELDHTLTEAKDILRKNTESHGRMKGLLEKPKVEPGDVVFNTSAATEFLKVVKKIQGELKVMTMKCDQYDKIAKGHDTNVDKKLVVVRGRVTDMNEVFKNCMTLYKAMMETAEATRKKAAKK